MANSNAGEKTLVILDVGSHGFQKNLHFVVCNDDVVGKINYPFEKNMRILASQKNCWVLAIFNACRMDMPPEFRAGGGGEDEEEFKEDPRNGSFLLILGCKPEKGVLKNSPMLKTIFDKFKSIASRSNGTLILPGEDFVLQRDNEIESVLKATQQLLLKHAAIEPNGPMPIDD